MLREQRPRGVARGQGACVALLPGSVGRDGGTKQREQVGVQTLPVAPFLIPFYLLTFLPTTNKQVRKVKGGKYQVGQVLSSGPLWVERERVRMSPKGARNLGKGTHAPVPIFSRDAAAAALSSTCSIM